MTHKDIAIVTGASSGIGREIARLLRKEDDLELWLVARRKDRLEAVAAELSGEGHSVRVLDYDLVDPNSWLKLQNELKASGQNLRWLINNAGFGFNGSFLLQEISHVEKMIMLNVLASTSITRRLLPFMKKGSKVVNISSSLAFVPAPFYSVYAATKAFVLSFSVALSEELKEMGISVSAVCPGPVETEFFDTASAETPKYVIEDPKHTAFLAIEQAAQGKPIILTGFMSWVMLLMATVLPRIWIAKLVSNQTKK